MSNYVRWLQQVWPVKVAPAAARSVVADYATIGQAHKHFLTDVALRGSVFTPMPPPPSLFHAGVAEGRRQLALEILETCRANPADLFNLVVTKPQGERQ